jgi:hypothetical protein
MKIALILLFCLVSVSYQQQQKRSWMSSPPGRYSYYISPRLLLDYIYANQYAEEDQFNYEPMVFYSINNLMFLNKKHLIY